MIHINPALFPCYSLRLFSASSSYPSSDAFAAACAPSKSNPSCSQHFLETHVPNLRNVSSHRPRTSRIKIYCGTIFCLFRNYTSTSSNPASCITYSKVGYYQLPS